MTAPRGLYSGRCPWCPAHLQVSQVEEDIVVNHVEPHCARVELVDLEVTLVECMAAQHNGPPPLLDDAAAAAVVAGALGRLGVRLG